MMIYKELADTFIHPAMIAKSGINHQDRLSIGANVFLQPTDLERHQVKRALQSWHVKQGKLLDHEEPFKIRDTKDV